MKKIEVSYDREQLTLDKGEQAVKDAVTAIRNGMRAGTASTLSKGEVAGSNKKPWKQKGTGNARAGFRQSPVWRGGGVAHGPHPRSFATKVNKKVMKLAFARAFSDRLVAGDVIVLDEISLEAPKTKLMAKLFKDLGVDRTAVVVQKDVDDTVFLATRNLPRIDYTTAQALDVYTLLASRKLVCDKAGHREGVEAVRPEPLRARGGQGREQAADRRGGREEVRRARPRGPHGQHEGRRQVHPRHAPHED